MGQPIPANRGYHPLTGWGALGELKHLSTLRNREYSRSSGERNGRSRNLVRAKTAVVAHPGLDGPVHHPAGVVTESETTSLPERCWKGRPE
jgi:hypothetical protein